MSIIDSIWLVFIWGLVSATLVATLAQSIPWPPASEKHPVLVFLVHPGWLFPVLFFAVWHLGAYARGEMSPLPWHECADELRLHGWSSAVLATMTVSTVSLWSFWTAANLWWLHHPDMDRSKRIMAHVINAFFGLVVTQIDNPIYRLINRLV